MTDQVPTMERPIRTDEEIVAIGVQLTKELAKLQGWNLLEGETIQKALKKKNTRVQMYWQMACLAFELIEGTPLEDALTNVEDAKADAEREATPAPQPMFADEEGRRTYFGRIFFGAGESVEYGDWLRQAAYTRLGLFSSSAVLKQDCATIAAAEVYRLLHDPDEASLQPNDFRISDRQFENVSNASWPELRDRIMHCGAFLNEFRVARARPDWELEVRVREATQPEADNQDDGPLEYLFPEEPCYILMKLVTQLAKQW